MTTTSIASGGVGAAHSFQPRAWTAAVLNLALAGLGYLYAGHPFRAGVAFLGLHVWIVALLLLTFAAPSAVLRIGLLTLALVGPYVLLPLDAARVAQHAPRTRRRWYQRWYALLAAWVTAALLVQGATLRWIKAHVAEAFSIPTGSMAPTLLVGDLILASRPRNPVRRGDVVIYRVPDDDRRYLHRAVGIPGDTVAMRAFRLSINGRPHEGPQAVPRDANAADHADDGFAWQRTHLVPRSDTSMYRPTYGTWGPLALRADEYFVLGDDLANSLDSRYRGVVSRAAIVGRPVWVYFSRDPETKEIRWSRMGHGVR